MRSISVRSPSAWATTALLALALAVSGCGPGDSEEDESGEAVGQELGGSVAQLVQCRDWAAASDAQKQATIEDIRSQVNRQDAGVESSALSDEEAMEVFDNGCREPYAAGFRLHILYARAAALEPLREIAEGQGG